MLGTGDCVCFHAMFVVLCGGEGLFTHYLSKLNHHSLFSKEHFAEGMNVVRYQSALKHSDVIRP